MKPVAVPLVAILLAGSTVYAERPARPEPQPVITSDQQLVRGEDLPVSLERIKRRLAQAPPAERDLLRLQYYVEVHGRVTAADIFANFDLHHGPVPHAAPTHREILDVVTPELFRNPPADLMTPLRALIEWLTSPTRDRSDGR